MDVVADYSQMMARRATTTIAAWPELMDRLRAVARDLGVASGPKHDRMGPAIHAALWAFTEMKRAEQVEWLKCSSAARMAAQAGRTGDAEGEHAKHKALGQKARQASRKGRGDSTKVG